MTSSIIFLVLIIAIGGRNYLTKNKSYDTGIIGQVVEEDKYFKIIKQADAEYFILEDISLAVSPIIKAEFLDENTLNIVYMSGQEFKEKAVVLNLN
jgi:hypothetical protein